VVDQVVDDLELARGAVLAGQAAEQRFDEAAHEAGEDAGRFRGVRVGDLVASASPADLFERRFEPAGHELFVKAGGTNRIGGIRMGANLRIH
jgi:hypothetical protein